jgi:hypothetical protein
VLPSPGRVFNVASRRKHRAKVLTPELEKKILGIVGEFEPLHAMRLHIVALPDSVNDGAGDP